MSKKNLYPCLAVFVAVLLANLACGGVQVGVEMTPGTPAAPIQKGQENTPTIEPTMAPTVTMPATEAGTQEAVPEGPGDSILRVAYVKEGNVWLWEEGSGNRPLTNSGQAQDVRISDDGQVIAFIRRVSDFESELWAVNADGSGERLLVGLDALQGMDPEQRDPQSKALNPYRYEWAPGTHTLAFNTNQVFEGPGMGNFDDLRQVDADSGAISTLLPAGQGGDFFYSPDGKKIALVTPDQIGLVNSNGSGLKKGLLTFDRVITYSEYQYYPQPVWAADSSYLAVAIPPADPLAQPVAPTRLYRILVDGSPAVEMGSVTAMALGAFNVFFSPDLSRIAYIQSVGQPPENSYELHLASSDGNNDTVFVTDPALLLHGWAADSNRILFGMGPAMQIQVGTVGNGFQPLSEEAAGIFDIRWIDPQQILYVQEKGGVFELVLEALNDYRTLIDSISGNPPGYDFDS